MATTWSSLDCCESIGQVVKPLRPLVLRIGHGVTPRYFCAKSRISLAEAERSGVTIGDRAVWTDQESLGRTSDLQRCTQHDIWIGQLWVGPGRQLRKLDGQVRSRVGVIDSHDHEIGIVCRTSAR